MKMKALLIFGEDVGPNPEVYEAYKSISISLFDLLKDSYITTTLDNPDFDTLKNSFSQKYDLIIYAGHGNVGNGYWILKDLTLTKEDLEKELKDIVCHVYSTCCYSHKSFEYTIGPTFFGFSTPEKPLTNGDKLISLFLQKSTLQSKCFFLKNFSQDFPNFFSEDRSREQNESEAFTKLEEIFKAQYRQLDISLAQKKIESSHYKKLINDIRNWPPFRQNSNGNPYPLGFDNFQAFKNCIHPLYEKLQTLDPAASVVIHGSSINGYRFKAKDEGLWFGEHSDYDVALCSQKLFDRVGAKKSGDHTKPLERKDLIFEVLDPGSPHNGSNIDIGELGLNWPRPKVNFMIYESKDKAQHHTGLSLVVDFGIEMTTYWTGECALDIKYNKVKKEEEEHANEKDEKDEKEMQRDNRKRKVHENEKEVKNVKKTKKNTEKNTKKN